jgi:cytochrome c oxidase subunit 2
MNRSRPHARGSAAAALLLVLVLTLLVAATVVAFAAHIFPAPAPITAAAILVDEQYARTLYVAGTVFVLAQLGLAFAVFRFRDRGKPVRFSRGSVPLEILWTSITLIVFVGLAVAGRKAWAIDRTTPPAPDAIQVEVTESQFVFTFRYPGPDGKFGRLDPRLVDAPAGNPLGLDPHDPNGKDDVVSATLTVPVNRPIELLLRSQDVVHNFDVRELRLQQDAVPGMMIPIHFTATKIGTYAIVCTQLCGLGHNKMNSALEVVPYEKYRALVEFSRLEPNVTPFSPNLTAFTPK